MATYQEQIEAHRLKREAKEKAEAERIAQQMTPEQIKHWRQVLARTPIGPAAYVIPDSMVQLIRDRVQSEINANAGGGDEERNGKA